MFGASRQARDSVFIALGTGIAAALASSGAAIRGASGCAGELGHIPVFPASEPCTCGQRGCLEVYASGAGIARRYAARTGQEGTTAEDVAARVSTDSAAAAVWSEAISALSAAIATLTLVLDPNVVVIDNSGVAGAGETLLGPLRKAVGSLLQWRPVPNIEQSRLGTSAAKIGVALLPMRAAGREPWSAAPRPATVLAPRP